MGRDCVSAKALARQTPSRPPRLVLRREGWAGIDVTPFRHSPKMYKSAALLFLAAGIGSAAAADQVPATEASLKPRLVALLPESRPLKPIARTLQTEEWQFKRGSGEKLVHSRSLYVPQEAGLVRVEGANSLGGSLRAVLVCGLIALHSYRFFPGKDVTTETKVRLIGFETSSEDICRPSAGAEFSYRMHTERRFRIASWPIRFGEPRTIAETIDVQCKADAVHSPASAILPTLEGNALRVRCERNSTTGHTATFDYAFLPDSGLYLRLREQGRDQAVEVRYTEIRYRNQG